jgi:hypothetical protein
VDKNAVIGLENKVGVRTADVDANPHHTVPCANEADDRQQSLSASSA